MHKTFAIFAIILDTQGCIYTIIKIYCVFMCLLVSFSAIYITCIIVIEIWNYESVSRDTLCLVNTERRRVVFSSAFCYCTAELLSPRGRPLSVVRPSVRKHRFHGNHQMDWHQILLTGTYPPYLQTIFFFSKFLIFYIFFSFSLT